MRDDPSVDFMPGLPLWQSRRALEQLARHSAEALKYFDLDDFDTAAAELIKCREAVRVLDGIRREQRAKAKEEASRAG